MGYIATRIRPIEGTALHCRRLSQTAAKSFHALGPVPLAERGCMLECYFSNNLFNQRAFVERGNHIPYQPELPVY